MGRAGVRQDPWYAASVPACCNSWVQSMLAACTNASWAHLNKFSVAQQVSSPLDLHWGLGDGKCHRPALWGKHKDSGAQNCIQNYISQPRSAFWWEQKIRRWKEHALVLCSGGCAVWLPHLSEMMQGILSGRILEKHKRRRMSHGLGVIWKHMFAMSQKNQQRCQLPLASQSLGLLLSHRQVPRKRRDRACHQIDTLWCVSLSA